MTAGHMWRWCVVQPPRLAEHAGAGLHGGGESREASKKNLFYFFLCCFNPDEVTQKRPNNLHYPHALPPPAAQFQKFLQLDAYLGLYLLFLACIQYKLTCCLICCQQTDSARIGKITKKAANLLVVIKVLFHPSFPVPKKQLQLLSQPTPITMVIQGLEI